MNKKPYCFLRSSAASRLATAALMLAALAAPAAADDGGGTTVINNDNLADYITLDGVTATIENGDWQQPLSATYNKYPWVASAKSAKGLMSNNWHIEDGSNRSYSVSSITLKSDKRFILHFDFAVSSEGNDYLEIRLTNKKTNDDMQVTYFSGTSDDSFGAPLPAGEYKLRLKYQKDESGHAGDDRAYVSNLTATTDLSATRLISKARA